MNPGNFPRHPLPLDDKPATPKGTEIFLIALRGVANPSSLAKLAQVA